MFRSRDFIAAALIIAVLGTAGSAASAAAVDRVGQCSADVNEVLIGYFGPASSTHRRAGDMWCAASLAIEEANRAGGYQGHPFRLVTGWSEDPWGSGVAAVARMAYEERVWAIVGGIDGPSTHLAEQVAAKARLVLINPVASDKSINMASVPWMFSCVPLDDAQARVLAEAIGGKVRREAFVIVSAVDHDSHVFAVELLKALKDLELAPTFHFQCDPLDPESRGVLDRVVGIDPAALVLVADTLGSARALRQLREKGYAGVVFGGPWMGRRAFAEKAGKAGEGVMFPHLWATSAKSRAFEDCFGERFGRRPDYVAAHTYDALSLLVAAIRKGELDRARIAEAVREGVPWSGVSGSITWNAAGANLRRPQLGTIADGTVRIVRAPNRAERR
ncbi:MAG: ABC transporter substrate-binding protein [Planctomycetota bacterium]|jgi:ABC-type branched-subunit amino acid transport system substrate-binding protein